MVTQFISFHMCRLTHRFHNVREPGSHIDDGTGEDVARRGAAVQVLRMSCRATMEGSWEPSASLSGTKQIQRSCHTRSRDSKRAHTHLCVCQIGHPAGRLGQHKRVKERGRNTVECALAQVRLWLLMIMMQKQGNQRIDEFLNQSIPMFSDQVHTHKPTLNVSCVFVATTSL
jgi:hypothetical protein